VTAKGQGLDPKIVEAPYLYNGARYTDGYNGPPIENDTCGVQWSRDG